MTQRSGFSPWIAFLCAAICFAAAVSSAGQAQTLKDVVAAKPSHPQPADVSGNWQVSWQGRLGTEQCTLQLRQDNRKLSGTFRNARGISSLSGTVEENRISFDVKFEGPHPFTTRFNGNVNGDKIDGTSQAVDVTAGGAYLGHGGEIVHPEHPWTATRVTTEPAHSGEPDLSPNHSARK